MERIIDLLKLPVTVVIILAMLLGPSVSPAFASAPVKEKVKYLGSGKVEVEFRQDVDYRRTKVTVKDTSGKTYTASIYSRDDDELKFRIKQYKKGKTYKFTISGVRQEYTSKYGKVTGTVKIPKERKKNVTAKQALNIALKDAGLKRSQVRNVDVEKDWDDGVKKYEISFETRKWEYDYELSMKGSILHREKERNDDYYDEW